MLDIVKTNDYSNTQYRAKHMQYVYTRGVHYHIHI